MQACPECHVVLESAEGYARHRAFFCNDGGPVIGSATGGATACSDSQQRALPPPPPPALQQPRSPPQSYVVRRLLSDRGVDHQPAPRLAAHDGSLRRRTDPAATALADREAFYARAEADLAALKAAAARGSGGGVPGRGAASIGGYTTRPDPWGVVSVSPVRQQAPRFGRRSREAFLEAEAADAESLGLSAAPAGPQQARAAAMSPLTSFFPQQREAREQQQPFPYFAVGQQQHQTLQASSADGMPSVLLPVVQRLRQALVLRGESHLARDAGTLEAQLVGALGGAAAAGQQPQQRLPPLLRVQLDALMEQMHEQLEQTSALLRARRPEEGVRDEVAELRREVAVVASGRGGAGGDDEGDEATRQLDRELGRLRKEHAVKRLRVEMQEEEEKWLTAKAEARRLQSDAEARERWARQQEEERQRAGEAGADSGAAEAAAAAAAAGFVLFVDRVTGLPMRADPRRTGRWDGAEVRAVFSFFREGQQVFPLRDLPPRPTAQDARHPAHKVCLFAQRKKVTSLPLEPNVVLLVEVQLVVRPAAGPDDEPETAPHAWAVVPVTDRKGALRAGGWRAPLFFCPVDTSAAPRLMDETFQRLEEHASNRGGVVRHQLYVRFVPPKDLAAELSRDVDEVDNARGGRGVGGLYAVPKIYRRGEADFRELVADASSSSSSSATGTEDATTTTTSEEGEGGRGRRRKKERRGKKKRKKKKSEGEEEAAEAQAPPPPVSRRASSRVSLLRMQSGDGSGREPLLPADAEEDAAAASLSRQGSRRPSFRSSRGGGGGGVDSDEFAAAAASEQEGEEEEGGGGAGPQRSGSFYPRQSTPQPRAATKLRPVELRLPNLPRSAAVRLTLTLCRPPAGGGGGDDGAPAQPPPPPPPLRRGALVRDASWELPTLPVSRAAAAAAGGVVLHYGHTEAGVLEHAAAASLLLVEVWIGSPSTRFTEQLVRWAAVPAAAAADGTAEELRIPLHEAFGGGAPAAAAASGHLSLKIRAADPASAPPPPPTPGRRRQGRALPPSDALWLAASPPARPEPLAAETRVFVRVDAGRHFPRNVCVSRVVGRWFAAAAAAGGGVGGGASFSAHAEPPLVAVQSVSSDPQNPRFTSCLEEDGREEHGVLARLHAAGVAACFCLLTVESVDAATGRPAVLGYATLPLVDAGAASVSQRRVQLRLRTGPLPPRPVSPAMLDAAAAVPLATLLVTVSCTLPLPRPRPYASLAYDTAGARPRAREVALHAAVAEEEGGGAAAGPATVEETLSARLHPGAPAAVARQRVEKLFGSPGASASGLVDLAYVKRYCATDGVSLRVEGATGLPALKGAMYKAVARLHPGGRAVLVTLRSDWGASVCAPRWLDPPLAVAAASASASASASSAPLSDATAAFVEVVSVRHSSGGSAAEAWACVPLLLPGGRFARHGRVRVPLYQGRVTPQVLQDFAAAASVDAFLAGLGDERLLRWAALTVAVADGARGHELVPADARAAAAAARPRSVLDPRHLAAYNKYPSTNRSLRATLRDGSADALLEEDAVESLANERLAEETGFAMPAAAKPQQRQQQQHLAPSRQPSRRVSALSQQQQQQEEDGKQGVRSGSSAAGGLPPTLALRVRKDGAGKVGIKYVGAAVSGVVPGGPGERAGVREGMTLVSLDGVAVENKTDAVREAFGKAPGSFRLEVRPAAEEGKEDGRKG